MLAAINRAFGRLLSLLSGIAGYGVMLLVIPTVLDVSYRLTFGPSVPGIVEYSEIGLVAVVFLGMASALRRNVHVSTPIFTSQLPGPVRHAVHFFAAVVVVVLLSLVTWGVIGEAQKSFVIGEYRFGLIEVPIWPAKGLVAFGMFLLWAEAVLQCIGRAAALAAEPQENAP